MQLLSQEIGPGMADGASVVAGITLTMVPVVVGYWLNRRRGNHVLVKEKDVRPLRSVDAWERSGHRPAPAQEGRAAAHLHQLLLEITNRSPETINDVALTLTFADGTEIVDVDFGGVPDHDSPPRVLSDSPPNVVTITIPFLNSYRLHKDRVSVRLTCAGSPKLLVAGRGKGWSVTHMMAQDAHRCSWLSSLIIQSCFLAFLGINLLFSLWLRDWLNSFVHLSLLGLLFGTAVLLVFYLAYDLYDVFRQIKQASHE